MIETASAATDIATAAAAHIADIFADFAALAVAFTSFSLSSASWWSVAKPPLALNLSPSALTVNLNPPCPSFHSVTAPKRCSSSFAPSHSQSVQSAIVRGHPTEPCLLTASLMISCAMVSCVVCVFMPAVRRM